MILLQATEAISEQEEFFINFIIYGSIIFCGLLVSIVIGAFAWKLYGLGKKKNIIKELYGKERKNGQGGSQGSY